MRFTEAALTMLLAAAAVPAARAESSAELADLTARIDYGFYHDDARAIDAARAALEQLGDGQGAVYARDYAALRRAQLGSEGRAGAWVRECAEREPPADARGPAAAEALVLAAACGVVGRQSGRRVEQALARARELDRRNPRIGLVEAWVLQRSGGDAKTAEGVAAKLEETIAAFDAWRAPPDAPDWGEAEALVALGELTLARGEARAARDLIERALLLAPDYGAAAALRTRLHNQ
jgi:hypothetical protein